MLMLSFLLGFWQVSVVADHADTEDFDVIDVLYINSYHQGYKWSDDIFETVLSVFDSTSYNVKFDIVYLDSKQMNLMDDDSFLLDMSRVVEAKYKVKDFELIMINDDAAFHFINNYCDFIDQDVPLIFSGVNDVEYANSQFDRPIGGIVEYMDVGETIDLMVEIDPSIDHIYYVIDNTITGQALNRVWKEDFKDYPNIEFKQFQGNTLSEILVEVAELGKGDAILFGTYFNDNYGHFYNYEESTALVAEKSSVPVYGMWDFLIGNGVLGGKLLSGRDQGDVMARMAIDYLDQGLAALYIDDDNINRPIFDYEVMQKFDIPVSVLPEDVDIVNFELGMKKNIFILHSYDDRFQWTNQINQGMMEVFNTYDGNLEIFTEYMDLKRISDPMYDYHFRQFFEERYGDKDFDLILTSDDGAFQFANQYLKKENDTPIVFCGVNYLDQEIIENHPGFTGVIEAYDVSGTIEAIVGLQPEINHILVINDQTLTGIGNNKNVQAVEGLFPDIDFSYLSALTMNEVLEVVANTGEESAILLLSYNKDRAGNTYSYQDAIELIYEYANVPLYGVWDFYLDNGLVGGYLTDAVSQGQKAAQIGLKVLEGQDPASIEILTKSPNSYKFDMNELTRFKLDTGRLPAGSLIINRPRSFVDVYLENPTVFNIIILILIFFIIATAVLIHYLRKNMRLNHENWVLAHYDRMTGILNRESGIEELASVVNNSEYQGQYVVIYFIDINELKFVNDVFGHKEGDHYIQRVVTAIASQIEDQGIFCRMGGDEFMVVLKYEERMEGDQFPTSIKQELRRMSLEDLREYTYSISIGSYQTEIMKGLNLSEIIERADKKMYRDKKIHRLLKSKEERDEN